MEIKRCYDTIVGASVGVNQLVQSGATSVTVQSGHKYYAKIDGTESIGASTGSAITINDSAKDMVTDLTAELGSTIADYVYTLEQATAGSGIAKLREWGFCTGYTAYNAGSIESVEVTNKVVRGFNAWDEEWENGRYNINTGDKTTSTTSLRCKNHIKVIPNTQYYVNAPVVAFFVGFDASGNCIGLLLNDDRQSATKNKTLTTPTNCYEIVFYCDSYSSYNHDICINISSPRNGEYEPYHSQSYPLGNDTLRGIFKLDANNNLYADGDVKTSDGTIARRYGYMLLNGSEEWSMPSTGYFALAVNNLVNNNNKVTIISNRFVGDSWARISGLTLDNVVGVVNGATVRFHYSTLSDVASWKSWLNTNNTAIVYELATPTTETSTPFPSPQVCYPDGTEEYVTSNGVPVGHETRYEL